MTEAENHWLSPKEIEKIATKFEGYGLGWDPISKDTLGRKVMWLLQAATQRTKEKLENKIIQLDQKMFKME